MSYPMGARGTSWVDEIWGSDFQRRPGAQERFERGLDAAERHRLAELERQRLELAGRSAAASNEAYVRQFNTLRERIDTSLLTSPYAACLPDPEIKDAWTKLAEGAIDSLHVTYSEGMNAPLMRLVRVVPKGQKQIISENGVAQTLTTGLWVKN